MERIQKSVVARAQRALVALGVVCVSVAAPRAQECTPGWQPDFGGVAALLNSDVRALLAFDDGSGPALFAAGSFSQASSQAVEGVARWNGSKWTPLPTLPGHAIGLGALVTELATFDAGSGPELYVGGLFNRGIRRWDGTDLSWPGAGLNAQVRGLMAYDDGSGEALYVTGTFTQAGGLPANHLAKWDGTSWSEVGGGVGSGPGYGAAFAVHDDGSGPALFVAGNFDEVGGSIVANDIARWDGTTWTPLAGGAPTNSVEIRALAVFDDGLGGGPQLYAAGDFTAIDGVAANGVARWDGAGWSAVGNGVSNDAYTLIVYDDGSGLALYVGGQFGFIPFEGLQVDNIARWDGLSWSAISDGGTNFRIEALAGYDDGNGAALYAGGFFSTAGGVISDNIAELGDDGWRPLSNGFSSDVLALASYDEGHGAGEQLFAAGKFSIGGNHQVRRIARWSGTYWEELTDPNVTGTVNAMHVFDDGGPQGESLYVAGVLNSAGREVADNIVRWDGTSWSTLDGGIDLAAMSLADYAGDLYAGGQFSVAGGVAAPNVARWNGTGWSAVGALINGNVRALQAFNDGGGERLIAGGGFTTSGGTVVVNHIAAWDGASWSALGSGMDARVRSLALFDDGNGFALYAGGDFTTAGGVAAGGIARWDGASWSAVGGGTDGSVRVLKVFDDGTGPALFAGGVFTTAGGQPARNAARWDGTSWSSLESGANGPIYAMQAFDLGDGPRLQIGGAFTNVGGRIAGWGCDPTPWDDLGGGTAGIAGVPDLSLSGPLTPASFVTLDLIDAAPSALAVIFLSFRSTPASFLGGTLHAFPVDEIVLFGTDGAGEIHGTAYFPGAPPGASLWFQIGIEDASVPLFGASLSGGVVGVVP